MGWNCFACGELLTPLDDMSLKVRKHLCEKCKRLYVVIAGHYYEGGVMICIQGAPD